MTTAVVLARLQAQDVDSGAATSTATLFVRCRQKVLPHSNGSAESNDSGAQLPTLHLDVAEGDALWRGEVTEKHKPMVLDCSASEYLSTLKCVFNARATATDIAAIGDRARRAFVYKWSRKSGVLTLMEGSSSGFAMKYTSLALTRVRDGDDEKQRAWQGILQEVVDVGAHATQEMTRQRMRIDVLEKLFKEKDSVLETALQAKQELEDQFFEGFCAVLNAKKDEIQRLQHELVVAQMQMQMQLDGGGQSNGKKPSSAASKQKKPRKPRATKTKGAKLKRKAVVDDDDEDEEQSSSEQEEAESHDDASDSQGDHNEDEDDDDDSADNNMRSSSRRGKRDAINAYSQLPSEVRGLSQVCSADDVLSNLDAIIKEDDEANATIQEYAGDSNSSSNGSSRAKRLRATAPPMRRAQEKKLKSEASFQEDADVESRENEVKPAASVPPPPPQRTPPAPARAMDSEEEDLFDMLC